MLRILGRGRSVPTVNELIFVRAQCLTILLFKHFALRGTINWIQLLFHEDVAVGSFMTDEKGGGSTCEGSGRTGLQRKPS